MADEYQYSREEEEETQEQEEDEPCPDCGDPLCLGNCPESQERADPAWMHDSAYDQ